MLWKCFERSENNFYSSNLLTAVCLSAVSCGKRSQATEKSGESSYRLSGKNVVPPLRLPSCYHQDPGPVRHLVCAQLRTEYTRSGEACICRCARPPNSSGAQATNSTALQILTSGRGGGQYLPESPPTSTSSVSPKTCRMWHLHRLPHPYRARCFLPEWSSPTGRRNRTAEPNRKLKPGHTIEHTSSKPLSIIILRYKKKIWRCQNPYETLGIVD